MARQADEKRRRTLDPKLDLVFSLLFGAEQNRRLLVALLNAVLRPPAPIVEIEVLPPQSRSVEVEGKLVVLDLRVRLQSGEQIDVEMQSRRHPALRERVLFYWARLYTGQLQRGDGYSKLRRCAVVLIADFVELASPSFHTVFQARERSSGQLLTDQLELHLVELPKLRNVLAGTDEPALARWCRFLAADADEELEVLAMEDPILREAKEALEKMSADPEMRERAERLELEMKFYQIGLAKERAQGRLEGKGGLLVQLLGGKFGALSPPVTERIASATEADLDRWFERLLSASTLDAVFD
jgi:predicted transposase/invertase (TIGR01784 family)